jgi:outer membrane immunogenic protein
MHQAARVLRLVAFVMASASIPVSLSFSAASAADLPRPVYKAPAAYLSPVPVYNWTGFYVGIHGGYGWSKFTETTGGLTGGSADADGWLGGFQLGYNYQFGRFVLGVEGEYSFADVKISEALFAGSITLKNDFFASVAARFGYAFDRSLLYGKIGAAWTRDKWDANDGTGGTATGDFSRTGWLLGAGYEYAFWNNFTGKIEYNYLMFDSITENLATTGTLSTTGPADVKLHTHILKVGLNYKFF